MEGEYDEEDQYSWAEDLISDLELEEKDWTSA